ncbi:MAG: type IV pilus modification PilV family protein [Planctomycetota bacterium]
MQARKYNGGFSLIEVLIAVMLVGLAVAALMAANAALTKANGAGTDLSTAEFLIGEIAELTALLPVVDPNGGLIFGPETGEVLANYDDLDDFDGENFSPPINAERAVLNSSAGFSQQIAVEKVSPSDFEQVVPDNDLSDFVRVTVTVFLNGRQISSASWLRASY